MFSKVLLFTLCINAAALKMGLKTQPDEPVEFGRAKSNTMTAEESEGPIGFARQRVSRIRQMQAYTFEHFMHENEKTYVQGSPEYNKRAGIFEKRKAEVLKLASRPYMSWTPGMNKFLDYTDAEFKVLLGYKPFKSKSVNMARSKARQPMEPIPANFIAEKELDWRPQMKNSIHFQKDQGACGSCWAVAATSAIEAIADIKFNMSVPLSMQQLVSCTPNPHKCGGSGGCGGATAELALDWLQTTGGMAMAKDWEYVSMFGDSGSCEMAKAQKPVVVVSGYKSIPQNNHAALTYALNQGPVVVAVDASAWSFYADGIFDSCDKDAILNHAVLAVGYGSEQGRGYWLIRNSWGEDWGDAGYIKLARAQNHAASTSFCGMDKDPQQGSACEGENDPVKVCGMCGVLYEPVLPEVSKVNKPENFEAIVEEAKGKMFARVQKRQARKIQQ